MVQQCESVYLVEELHQHKGIEDQCVMLRGPLNTVCIGHVKNLVPMSNQAIHDCQLKQALSYNVLGHLQLKALPERRIVTCSATCLYLPSCSY